MSSFRHDDEFAPLNGPPAQSASAQPSMIFPLSQSPFRYRKRTLGLLLIYIPLLIIPWVLTCILSVRPVTEPTYINQQGRYSPTTVRKFQIAVTVARVMTSIAAVLTVPVISAVLAHATVIYTQRRKSTQALHADQMFALADRAWQNAAKMANVIRRSFSSRGSDGSSLLWFGAFVLVIGALQQPLQQLLVSTKPIVVMTCRDLVFPNPNISAECDQIFSNSIQIGYDPEPQEMAVVPQNIIAQTVRQQIMTITEDEPQANFWPEGPTTNLNSSERLNSISSIVSDFAGNLPGEPSIRSFFVASLPNGTTTGILRQHATRFNTTVNCTHIDTSQVPRPCPGTRPFQTTFSLPGSLDISVCVPGAFDRSPWNLTRDRQDLSEDIYMDVSVPGTPGNPLLLIGSTRTSNFTIHCSATTSRGYFELGNLQNANVPGPLLGQWPSSEELAANFNDEIGSSEADGSGSANDTDPDLIAELLNDIPLNPSPFSGPQGDYMPTPGPLMTTAIATFGNNTFFEAAKANLTDSSAVTFRQICQPGALPFARLKTLQTAQQFASGCDGIEGEWQRDPKDARSDTSRLPELMFQFMNAFNDTSWAQEAMYAGTFLANRAMLTVTDAPSTASNLLRPISTSDGTSITVPIVSLAAIVGLSVLVAMQVLLLVSLAMYIYSAPTWTTELNARAIAKLACLQEPGAFGSFDQDEPKPWDTQQPLSRVSGVVGIDTQRGLGGTDSVHLTLGGSGIISRAMNAPRSMKGEK